MSREMASVEAAGEHFLSQLKWRYDSTRPHPPSARFPVQLMEDHDLREAAIEAQETAKAVLAAEKVAKRQQYETVKVHHTPSTGNKNAKANVKVTKPKSNRLVDQLNIVEKDDEVNYKAETPAARRITYAQVNHKIGQFTLTLFHTF
jgi:hypothetical protein